MKVGEKPLFSRDLTVNLPTKCSLIMILCCVLQVVRIFVDFIGKIEVF